MRQATVARPGLLRSLALAVNRLPQSTAVARFDGAADRLLERHVRGHRVLDLVMYGASAVGDHSMAWVALAAFKGWRRGSLASTLGRTTAALAFESTLVNGLVKLAFRRTRPIATEPRPLPLRTPRTSSFPSGHASSAFFAAAILRERRTWPLYYAAAVTIATSRAYVRIHHASDVVAGAAVGAALGELARPLVRGTTGQGEPL